MNKYKPSTDTNNQNFGENEKKYKAKEKNDQI